MADYRDNNARYASVSTQAGVEIDEGLRAYMLRVYNYMALAVGITGVAALGMATWAQANPAVAGLLYASPLKWVIMLAPLAFILVLSFGINKLSAAAAQMTLWAFAVVMGVSMSWIFMVFNMGSIAQTFFITAAAFGALSLYGYTTKRDLSGMGTFLLMGLVGLILASLANLFFQSGALGFAVNVIGVLIFAGLTAYDTQRIKETYDVVAHNGELMAKSAVMGALSLYLDFVNMFMFLLQFLGDRE